MTVERTLSVIGMKELYTTLGKLESDVRKNLRRGAIRAALKPVLDEVIRRVPVGETGNLANSFRISVKKSGLYGEVKTNRLGAHAHLVEFGHRIVNSRGEDTGKRVPAHPFFRPAWDQTQDEVLQTLIDKANKTLKRLEKRGRI